MPVLTNENKALTPEMQKLEYSKTWRTNYELKRFVTQMFIEQWAYYKQSKGKLEQAKPQKWYRDVAKARTVLRGIKNAITRDEPRRQAKHFTLETDYDEDERRLAMRALQDVYRKQHIKEKIKDMIHNAMMKSIGFRQIYYDGDKKCIKVQDIDAFDIYLDPHGRLEWPIFKGRWMIKAIPMPVTCANEKRPEHKFTSDNKTAESSQKVALKNSEEATGNNSEFWTIMVYEIYDKKDGKIEKTIYINNEVIETETLEQEDYPIICYQPERYAGKVYPTAWMDPIIELNKSLNRIYTSLEDRIYTFSKGRRLAKRNENISNMTDQNWQIVYYDNIPPAYMQQWSPGDTPFNMMGITSQYIEDAWGTHAESMGRTSGANIRSASQISQIQAWDIQNMAESVDNLRTFLSVAWEMILDIASKNVSEKRRIKDGNDYVDVVWSEAVADIEKLGAKNKDVKKIKPFKNIEVDIVPWTSFTDMQTRQDLITLREIGVMIPDEILIETFKIGDTDEILSKMRLDEQKNKNPDIDIASAENKKMIMGMEVMADMTEDHRIHKSIHAKLLEAQKNNVQLAQMIVQHIKQHEAFERPDVPEEMPGTAQPPQMM